MNLSALWFRLTELHYYSHSKMQQKNPTPA